MGEILFLNKTSSRILVVVLYVVAISASNNGFSTAQEDETGREFLPQGAHQLASFIMAQLRRGDYPNQLLETPMVAYKMPHARKRNSAELTSSIMGIPRNMIDNGRK